MSTVADRTARRTTPSDSPYVGLTYYTEDQAASFFGREAERKMIIGNVRASRLTLLYAESGVGKSSLLRAGVAARLRELAARGAAERGSPRYVPVVFSAWRDDPTAGLIDAIWRSVAPFRDDGPPVRPDLASLEDHIAAASDAIDATLLIILDQFEEYFLYHPREARSGTFGDEMARCVNAGDLRANFLIAIREDAYAALGDLFVGRITNVYGNYLHLDSLERHAARQAIVKAVAHYNDTREQTERVEIDPALVEKVLDDVARGLVVIGEAGRGTVDAGASDTRFVEASYLQLVMDRLWREERAAGSRTLRLDTLFKLGGAETIIRSHLDEAMADLAPDMQNVAAAAFRYLATPSGTKIALSVPDLAQLANVDGEELRRVVEHLCEVRILRPVAAMAKGADTRYEIFHDVLAAAVLDWRARYARTQEEQEHAARLERETVEREQAQREAIEAHEREERERRRARIFKGIAAACVVVAFAAIAALLVKARRDADTYARRVESALIAGRAAEMPAGARALGGLEAFRLSDSVDALAAIHTTLYANPALPILLDASDRPVNAVAFAPGSAIVAAARSDGTIGLWDLRGNSLGKPLEAESMVNELAFNPAGDMLLGVRDDATVDVWNVSSPRQPKLVGQTKLECSTPVAFSPDGNEFACGDDEGTVVIAAYDGAKGTRRLAALAAPDSLGKDDLAFSPDGSLLATGEGIEGLVLWDVSRPTRPRRLWSTMTPFTYAVAFAPNGSLLAASDEATIQLWDISRPKRPRLVRRLVGHADAVNGIAFSPDGRLLVSGGDDGSVISWDVATGRIVGPPRGHTGGYAVNDVAFADNGSTFASAGEDGDVKLWSTDNPHALAATVADPPPGDASHVLDIAVSPSGTVAVGTAAGVYFWTVGTEGAVADGGSRARRRPLHEGEWSGALAYDEDVLAVGHDGTLSLWDARDVRNPRLLDRSEDTTGDTITSIAFGPDGDVLATGDDVGAMSLWDTSDRSNVRHLATVRAHGAKSVHALAFAPQGTLLVSGGEDGKLRLWNVEDPSRPISIGAPIEGHIGGGLYALALAPEGDVLVTGGGDQRLVVWDLSDPRRPVQIGQPRTQSNSILDVAFSRDGSILAAADGDSSIVMWDVETRQFLGEFQGPIGEESAMTAIAFDPSGRYLVSGGRGQPIVRWSSRLWSRNEHELRTAVCALTRRNLDVAEWDELFARTRLEDERGATCPRRPLPG